MKVIYTYCRFSLCKDKNVERYVKQKCGVKQLDNNWNKGLKCTMLEKQSLNHYAHSALLGTCQQTCNKGGW